MRESRTLLLIRHGETAQNAAGRWQGQSDTPLSEIGLWQVQRLKARFDAGIGYELTGAFTSDLSRAHDTARIALGDAPVPLTITPLLRERSFGQWEGLTRDEVTARFGDVEHPEGGESWDAVWARMQRALELVFDATPAGGCAAVFGHGGALKTWIAYALGWDDLDHHRARRMALGNTGISVVTLEGPRLGDAHSRLHRFNDCTHLEGGIP